MNTKNWLPSGDLFKGIKADPQSLSNVEIESIIAGNHSRVY